MTINTLVERIDARGGNYDGISDDAVQSGRQEPQQGGGKELDPYSRCQESLQELIDSASPRATIEVPGGCIYREAITIDKPLTLKADPGAEIRGSDIWQKWTYTSKHWVSDKVYPTLKLGDASNARQHCQTDRCDKPEQVFVDGKPLIQVASEPQSGQFALSRERRVLLGDDPRDKVVEVSVRQYWVRGETADVTIDGFVMKHAATPNRAAAFFNGTKPNWTVKNSELAYAHSTNLNLKGGGDSSTHRILNNNIHHAGKMGLGGSYARFIVRDNHIHHNDTEGWDHWEAGGMKFVLTRSFHFSENEVDHNDDHGVWCDVQCQGGLIERNRVHHNSGQGIFWEGSYDAVIRDNVVYENGWPDHAWAKAGIMVATSNDVEVYDNLLAWNADGIVLQCQNRTECRRLPGEPTDKPEIGLKNIYVHENTIIAEDWMPDRNDTWAHAWIDVQNRSDGRMFQTRWNNRGESNRYWFPTRKKSAVRWRYGDKYYSQLTRFNGTRAAEADRLMTQRAKDQVLRTRGIPTTPEHR